MTKRNFYIRKNNDGKVNIFTTRPIYIEEYKSWEINPKRKNGMIFQIPSSFCENDLYNVKHCKIVFHKEDLILLGKNISIKKLPKENNSFYFCKNTSFFTIFVVGKTKPKVKYEVYYLPLKVARDVFGLKNIDSLLYERVYQYNKFEFILEY